MTTTTSNRRGSLVFESQPRRKKKTEALVNCFSASRDREEYRRERQIKRAVPGCRPWAKGLGKKAYGIGYANE